MIAAPLKRTEFVVEVSDVLAADIVVAEEVLLVVEEVEVAPSLVVWVEPDLVPVDDEVVVPVEDVGCFLPLAFFELFVTFVLVECLTDLFFAAARRCARTLLDEAVRCDRDFA